MKFIGAAALATRQRRERRHGSTFISLETGQPDFAFAAIDWNVAWSMPGIFAAAVR